MYEVQRIHFFHLRPTMSDDELGCAETWLALAHSTFQTDLVKVQGDQACPVLKARLRLADAGVAKAEAQVNVARKKAALTIAEAACRSASQTHVPLEVMRTAALAETDLTSSEAKLAIAAAQVELTDAKQPEQLLELEVNRAKKTLDRLQRRGDTAQVAPNPGALAAGFVDGDQASIDIDLGDRTVGGQAAVGNEPPAKRIANAAAAASTLGNSGSVEVVSETLPTLPDAVGEAALVSTAKVEGLTQRLGLTADQVAAQVSLAEAKVGSAKAEVTLAEAEVTLAEVKNTGGKAEVLLAKAEVSLAEAKVALAEAKVALASGYDHGDLSNFQALKTDVLSAKSNVFYWELQLVIVQHENIRNDSVQAAWKQYEHQIQLISSSSAPGTI